MQVCDGGWHIADVPDVGPGTLYSFVLPDGLRVPDPASRFQPQDVHGPSEVIDPDAFAWTDGDWSGRPWHEAVVYELHIGTFTPEGTFRAAIDRLDHLRDLGVTAIEIMPVADFPGARNWGYDGALLYAPDSTYGTPEDLKALVDAAHARGIMVLLDVVYNHFGPDGNYLGTYAPEFFTDRHKTPWGDGIHFEARPVRDFVIDNALYWITEFHLDGLRVDAVHAIIDDSKPHILEELATRLRALELGRPLHLVLENEDNTARYLDRDDNRLPRLYTAQWNDDVHHVLHVAATGESEGYYADYGAETERLGRALAEGFAFQGEMMEYRGHLRGEPSAGLPPEAFVAFIQNHDQIGNRAFGERITALASQDAVRAVAAVYLLLPQVPMLFMGEEWAASQPFPFFCDFHGELADAVREGRRNEFARFPAFHDPAMRSCIPDPQAEQTFLAAKLDWNDLHRPDHAAWLAWYRAILAMRKAEIVPRIPLIGGYAGRYATIGPNAVHVQWLCGTSERLILTANLSAETIEAPPSEGRTLHVEGTIEPDGSFAPWTCTLGRCRRACMTHPRATYRLQFHKGFGFDDAAALAPYLARLGISHVYASPYLKARPGSTHGYDIVDHDALNPELGDQAAFERMNTAFTECGLKQILDFVPNHMGVGGSDNPLWLDVLEWGADSAHAGWFDIDWDPDRRYLRSKLLIPFLGDQYGVVLEDGRLRLKFDVAEGSFAVWAYDTHKLPICPLHYNRILGNDHPDLERIGDFFAGLPDWRSADSSPRHGVESRTGGTQSGQ